MLNELKNKTELLLNRLQGLDAAKALALLSAEFEGGSVFSTSFSMEDQVITDLIAGQHLPVKIFTLDTGRLFSETYYVWSRTNETYNLNIEAYYPNTTAIEQFVTKKGPNSFYDAVENRKACCFLRKVEPLQRALAGNSLWITGLRAEHSPVRGHLPQLEVDESNTIIKYHPLLHWSNEQVRTYIHERGIPYNTLHDKGFVSIGCQPCTRAIRPGEDFRAGRWWWEDKSAKECGLHAHS